MLLENSPVLTLRLDQCRVHGGDRRAQALLSYTCGLQRGMAVRPAVYWPLGILADDPTCVRSEVDTALLAQEGRRRDWEMRATTITHLITRQARHRNHRARPFAGALERSI